MLEGLRNFSSNLDHNLTLLSQKGAQDLLCTADGVLQEKTIGHKVNDFFCRHKTFDDNYILFLTLIKEYALNPPEDSQKKDEQIKKIFFENIAKIKSQTLLSQLHTEGILDDEDFQNYLSPELKQAREAKVIALTNGNQNNIDDKDLDVRIQEVALALKLGGGKDKNKGTTGSMIVKDLSGKPKGVYKLNTNYISWWMWVIRFFKKTFFGQIKYLKNDTYDAQNIAEVNAYKASTHFGFNITPASKMTDLDKKNGVFMAFLDGYSEAGRKLNQHASPVNILNKKTDGKSQGALDESEIDLFQKFVIFDYLLGNLDRHGENWFVKMANATLTDIKAIDNANGFLKINPDKAGTFHQYEWRKLNIAKLQFSETSKKFIRKNLTPEKVERFIESIRKYQDADGITQTFLEFSTNEYNLRKRVEVLRNAAQHAMTLTPAKLGEIVTTEAIDHYAAQ